MTATRVALTGGIGSGKSTVAKYLRELGAYVVDADAIAREVVAPGTTGLAALAGAFGVGILTNDGDLDRAALARIAFSDPVKKAQLDAITHPLIHMRTRELFAAAPQDAVIVHDVALLTELGLAANYDQVVVVDCPDELRVDRLIGRGMDESDVRRRLASQASREQRLAIADVVIDNSGSPTELRTQVSHWWKNRVGRC